MTAAVYCGHPGGREEAEAVQRWAAGLLQNRYQALRYQFLNQKNDPPFLIAVEARG